MRPARPIPFREIYKAYNDHPTKKGKTMDITPELALEIERRRLTETLETRAQLQLRANEVQPSLMKNMLETGITGLTETIEEIQESINMLEKYLSLPLTTF